MPNDYGDFLRREAKLGKKPGYSKSAEKRAMKNKQNQFQSGLVRKIVADTQGGPKMPMKGFGN
jgi:hypothetical protein